MDERNKRRSKTSATALGGICLALTLVFIFAGSILPGIELTLFAASSVFTAVMIIESGAGAAAILYAASVILGIVFLPNKLAILPYAVFFGYYGIFKFYIEKIHGAFLQMTSKILFFSVVMSVSLIGFRELFLGSIHLPDLPLAVIIAAGVLILILYDFVYTMLINFYLNRIKRKNTDKINLSS